MFLIVQLLGARLIGHTLVCKYPSISPGVGIRSLTFWMSSLLPIVWTYPCPCATSFTSKREGWLVSRLTDTFQSGVFHQCLRQPLSCSREGILTFRLFSRSWPLGDFVTGFKRTATSCSRAQCSSPPTPPEPPSNVLPRAPFPLHQ